MSESWILVSAARFEVEPLLQHSHPWEYHSCGIGPVAAAVFAGRMASQWRDRRVLYVGTCGAFAPTQIGTIYRASSVAWSDPGLRSGHAYLVKESLPKIHFPESSDAHPLPSVEVLSSAGISTVGDPQRPEVENLELYGLAFGLVKEVRELVAILGVTNQVGQDAHQQWKRHFREVAEGTARAILACSAF